MWVETKLAYIVLVRGLFFSCDGLMSRSFCCGMMDVLVYLYFFCCVHRCPTLVAMDFVGCLLMRELLNLGHELKCPFVVAWRKVDGVGINMQAWKYPARSCLVCEFWMSATSRLFMGVGGVGTEEGVSGMLHKPLT